MRAAILSMLLLKNVEREASNNEKSEAVTVGFGVPKNCPIKQYLWFDINIDTD